MSEDDKAENLRTEYQDIGNNIRHYSSLRFGQMTLFLAATAGVATAIFNRDVCDGLKPWIALGGIVLVAVFWILEERSTDYWHHYMRRAEELERALGFSQYTRRPHKDVLSATNAVRLFYLVIGLCWVWYSLDLFGLPAFWRLPLGTASTLAGVVLLVCLVWKHRAKNPPDAQAC